MVSTLAFVFKIIRSIIFSAVKKINFPQSRKFSTVKKIFLDQGTLPQSRKFFAGKEIFHKQGIFTHTNIFPCSRKFSKNKDFYTVKNTLCKESQNLKAKILDPFNTKSHAKVFLTL